jgi:hypothetical protein
MAENGDPTAAIGPGSANMIPSTLPMAHQALSLLLSVAWRLIPPRQGPDATSASTLPVRFLRPRDPIHPLR